MGDALFVAYDYNAGRRIPIPANIRASILKLEARELSPPTSLKQLRSTP